MSETDFWLVISVGFVFGWIFSSMRSAHRSEQGHCAKCRAIIRRNRRIEKYVQ
jgi:hypothetical protein